MALTLVARIVAVIAIGGAGIQAQEVSYRLVDGWAELPDGVDAWGETIGVEVDADGSLWVFHRCFACNCVGRDDVAPVLKYDPSGRLLDSWGEGMFVWPHGFFLDTDGNIWMMDARGRDGKGQQVMKFSPDGTLLMTLGTPGIAGGGPNILNGPTDGFRSSTKTGVTWTSGRTCMANPLWNATSGMPSPSISAIAWFTMLRIPETIT